MISSNQQKIIVALVIIILLGFFGYSTLIKDSGIKNVSSGTSVEPVAGQDILDLVDKLRVISLDTDIFTSPLFLGLQDFTIPIFPESQRRDNPFLPIGSDINTNTQPQATSTRRL